MISIEGTDDDLVGSDGCCGGVAGTAFVDKLERSCRRLLGCCCELSSVLLVDLLEAPIGDPKTVEFLLDGE